MILPAFESVPTWSVDWGLLAIIGNKMPPRDTVGLESRRPAYSVFARPAR
jgi:hypothetical protein